MGFRFRHRRKGKRSTGLSGCIAICGLGSLAFFAFLSAVVNPALEQAENESKQEVSERREEDTRRFRQEAKDDRQALVALETDGTPDNAGESPQSRAAVLNPFADVEPLAAEPEPAESAQAVNLFPTNSQTWHSATGQAVLGQILAFDQAAQTVVLKRADGEIFEGYALDKLSEPDRQYLEQLAKAALTGKVIGISDGDTFTLLTVNNQQERIRLQGIDCPEDGQEFSNNAKQGLGQKIFGQEVSVRVTGRDVYKRTLGVVFVGRENVNLWLVQEGLAWHFTKYSDDEDLAAAEKQARSAKRGLWSAYKPMPPWDFRELGSAAQNRAQTLTSSPGKPSSPEPEVRSQPAASYWLNTSSYTRHNSRCRWFANTKSGRYCTKDEGRACGICGG